MIRVKVTDSTHLVQRCKSGMVDREGQKQKEGGEESRWWEVKVRASEEIEIRLPNYILPLVFLSTTQALGNCQDHNWVGISWAEMLIAVCFVCAFPLKDNLIYYWSVWWPRLLSIYSYLCRQLKTLTYKWQCSKIIVDK